MGLGAAEALTPQWCFRGAGHKSGHLRVRKLQRLRLIRRPQTLRLVSSFFVSRLVWPELCQNHRCCRVLGPCCGQSVAKTLVLQGSVDPVVARTGPKPWLLLSFKASAAKNNFSKFQSLVLARTWPKLRLLHGSKALSWPERGHNY